MKTLIKTIIDFKKSAKVSIFVADIFLRIFQMFNLVKSCEQIIYFMFKFGISATYFISNICIPDDREIDKYFYLHSNS
jgi:hypothetical protein